MLELLAVVIGPAVAWAAGRWMDRRRWTRHDI